MAQHLKFPRGRGPKLPSRPLHSLEWVTLLHVGLFVVVASWAFGGTTRWAHALLTVWGCGGVLITFTALRQPAAAIDRRALRWLLPFAALLAWIAASCFNPSLAPRVLDGQFVYVAIPHLAFWPSAARPDLAWRELLFFAGAYLSAFNLALVIQRRRALRWLLLIVAANALALSVLGTAQNLLRADIYFGAATARNEFFFATFPYHNHWGAFTLLGLSACTALVAFHVHRLPGLREFWHGPAFLGVVATFFVAATLPLSGSRSSSLLAVVLLIVVASHGLFRLVRRRRARRARVALPLLAIAAAALLSAGAIYQLARDTIDARVEKTVEQLHAMRATGSIGDRATLYRDTWRMARDRPWAGWGLESFGTVFSRYDSQESYRQHPPTHYEEAHSDWLQSLAEIGVVGTALLLATGLLPLLAAFRRRAPGAVTLPLWTGCALVVLYAAIEFPLVNPAVVITFWTVFFAAVRYTVLTRHDPRSPGSVAAESDSDEEAPPA